MTFTINSNLSSLSFDTFFFKPSGKEQDEVLQSCAKGKIAKVREWIKANKPFDVTDVEGRTLLMLASMCNNEAVFEHVWKNTIKLAPDAFHAVDNWGQNALFYACASDQKNRVEKLLSKNVAVVRAKTSRMAVEYSRNQGIHQLIGEQSQRILDKHGMILKACFERYGEDPEKMAEEVFKRTGQRIKNTDARNFELQNKKVQRFVPDALGFLTHPEMAPEIKEIFPNPPKNILAAAKTIKREFGYQPSEEDTAKILEEAEVKTRQEIKSLLKDKNELKKIRNYFREHPPQDLYEAVLYIKETYNYTVLENDMRKFLLYFGITFPSSSEVD